MCDAAEGAAIARLRGGPVMRLLEVPQPKGSAEDAMKGEAPSVLVLGVSEGLQRRWTVSQFRGLVARSMATRGGIELSTWA